MVRKALGIVMALLAASPAYAWHEYGHQTVAAIAWSYLTPRARAEAGKLLADAKALDTPTCPAGRIEDAAVWPDCILKLNDRFSYSAPWHYQNISVCRDFDPDEKCPGGQCVTAQIPRQARLLGDPAVPRRERLMALAFLIHFVGDMHQPLHIGENDDLGGNKVSASYGAISYERLNLHTVWDGMIAERWISDPPGGATGLRSEITPAQIAAWRQGGPKDWARESWERSKALGYANLPDGAGACTGKLTGRQAITPAYVAAARAAVRQGIEAAGVRAAMLINRALDPKSAL